jgi:hypothetical protein
MASSSGSPTSIFEEFCQLILGVDESIRFVGIATLAGAILARKYRANLTPPTDSRGNSVFYQIFSLESGK